MTSEKPPGDAAPKHPHKPTPMDVVGKPAVPYEAGTSETRRPSSTPSGHRRRGRSRERAGEGAKEPSAKAPSPAEVDLGLASNLPERPPEEEKAAEHAAAAAARGRRLSQAAGVLISLMMFILPFGLLAGARSIERVHREGASRLISEAPDAKQAAGPSSDSLPLLQPLPPLRASEPDAQDP